MKMSLLALLGALVLSSVTYAASSSPPNFIVIYGEGSGWTSTSVQMDERNPASKGVHAPTPNLERLASAGMVFSEGYAPSPRCTPSRAGLITGRSPAALHMTFVNNTQGNRKLLPPNIVMELPTSEVTIAEQLKTVGYATAHFGKWHLGMGSPAIHGFDETDGANSNGGPENTSSPNPKQAYAITTLGINFMERQLKAKKPFYLQVSHYPNQGPQTQEEVDADTVVTDKTIGQLLDAVKRLGLSENTYIIYTTDHGTIGENLPLNGSKGLVWEGGIRVPFFVSGPGIKPKSYSHVRVSQLDVFPTISALAKVKDKVPAGVEGGDISSVLLNGGVGSVVRLREEFVVHVPHYDPQSPASAIFLGNYKLIRIYETEERRLYDLAKDPYEKTDLSAQMPAKVAELDARLTKYLKDVNAQMTTLNPNPQSASAEGADTAGMAAGMAAGGMAAGMGAEGMGAAQ